MDAEYRAATSLHAACLQPCAWDSRVSPSPRAAAPPGPGSEGTDAMLLGWEHEAKHFVTKLAPVFVVIALVANVTKQLFLRMPSLQRLRAPGRPSFYSIGGKSGWELVYDTMVAPSAYMANWWMVVMVYIVLGALCMEALEKDREEEDRAALVAKMARYEARVSPEVYLEIAADLGYSAEGPWRSWDFAGALYYCFTLTTTIGYGSFGPQTAGGMVFTALYTLFGIPLMMYQLSVSGNAMLGFACGWFFHWVELYAVEVMKAPFRASTAETRHSNRAALECLMSDPFVGRRLRFLRRKVEWYFAEVDDGDGVLSDGELDKLCRHVAVHLVGEIRFGVTLQLFVLFVVVLPLTTRLHFMRSYCAGDDWSFAEAIYFSVITFATVGLGDYIPLCANEDTQWGGIFGGPIFYTYFGLLIVGELVNGALEHATINAFYVMGYLVWELIGQFFRTEWAPRRKRVMPP